MRTWRQVKINYKKILQTGNFLGNNVDCNVQMISAVDHDFLVSRLKQWVGIRGSSLVSLVHH